MPNSTCAGQLQVCMMRIARLNSTGGPLAGASNGYISDDLVSIDVGLELNDGDEFILKNGCGSIAQSFKDCDRVKRATLSMKLSVLDAEIIELLTGAAAFSSAGTVIGFQVPKSTASCSNGASVEVWAKAWDGSAQYSIASVPQYQHWVFPKVKMQLDKMTFENDVLQVALVGTSEENLKITSNGPFDDWPLAVRNGDGVTSCAGVFLDGTLPTAQCGYVTVTSAAS